MLFTELRVVKLFRKFHHHEPPARVAFSCQGGIDNSLQDMIYCAMERARRKSDENSDRSVF